MRWACDVDSIARILPPRSFVLFAKEATDIFAVVGIGQVIFGAHGSQYFIDESLVPHRIAKVLHRPVAARCIGLLFLRTRHANLRAVFDDFVNAMKTAKRPVRCLGPRVLVTTYCHP